MTYKGIGISRDNIIWTVGTYCCDLPMFF